MDSKTSLPRNTLDLVRNVTRISFVLLYISSMIFAVFAYANRPNAFSHFFFDEQSRFHSWILIAWMIGVVLFFLIYRKSVYSKGITTKVSECIGLLFLVFVPTCYLFASTILWQFDRWYALTFEFNEWESLTDIAIDQQGNYQVCIEGSIEMGARKERLANWLVTRKSDAIRLHNIVGASNYIGDFLALGEFSEVELISCDISEDLLEQLSQHAPLQTLCFTNCQTVLSLGDADKNHLGFLALQNIRITDCNFSLDDLKKKASMPNLKYALLNGIESEQ